MGPFRSVRFEPVVQFLERLWAEAVEPPLRLPPNLDQPGVSQHLEVPRDAGLVHTDDLDEVTDRALTIADGVEDASPSRLGDSFQHGGRCHALKYTSERIYVQSYVQDSG